MLYQNLPRSSFSIGLVLSACLVGALSSRAQPAGTASISVQVDQPGAVVSSNLFGIFFEEINFAGDGGLYAELVRNRSFAISGNPDFWTLDTQGSAAGGMTVDTSQPLNTNNIRSLMLSMTSGFGSVGAANSGYWGIAVQSGATYDLSFYARAASGFSGPIVVRLESADGGSIYAEASFNGLTTDWQRFAVALLSTGSNTAAKIVLAITDAGTVWLDEVSLFPHDTYAGRTNGLRLDLANKLADLQPSFYRYPGGNFIESWNITNAVRWKKTVGDVAMRPGHLNDSWGYWSTDGYGLDEFFRQCEDMAMAPLYGINAGLMLGYDGSPNNTVPIDEMGPWVQDALDLIEYANGDTNTPWGALRAANGHPAPYGLKLLEIGNENGGSYYNERYTLFYDAIKAQYPEIRLISPGNWGSPPWSRPRDISDEHYYSSPATFISYATKYDNYSRTGPKVFVGEYAVTSGYGAYGNLAAALGEAAFMTGIERNSDIVEMACYAPLFANVNGIQWHPDLIYYDGYRCFGTPAYYVQKMFSRNRGDAVLPTTVVAPSTVTNPPPHGAIGVGSWSTSVQYTNIVVTSNGVTLYQSDFVANGTNGWHVFNGDWSVNNGLYRQTSASTTDCRSTTGDTGWANYTLSLRARKVSGSEGFLILFNWTDDNNWTWLNLGGWGNGQHGVEQNLNGSKSILGSRVSGSIQANRWYDISVVLSNRQIRCYLDGALVLNVSYSTTSPGGLYASTTFDKESGQVIVKAVNPYSQDLQTTFELSGLDSVSPDATLIRLTSGSSADENSLASPTNVSPVTTFISTAGTNFSMTLPANSLSVLRLTPNGINTYTDLMFQLPSPIHTGQSVAGTVWGRTSGNWVDLTANTNHAITYRSLDPDVARVDIFGKVTGLAAGTVGIVADYGALGLSATQNVEVVYVPTLLAHRYSFNETSGSTVADTIGGPAWDGTLPNGGTFGSGRLALSAGAQQYVDLPPWILTNDTAVTIETWVTFPDQLPVNCFFFGFGDSIGGTGYNYIFCAPQAGRAAITGGNYSSEENAYTGIDFSYRTDFHLTFVFNPPEGYLAVYTNGILAGINTFVTTTFASVNNVHSWIGRSLYSADPYPNFTLDEFRIYDGALTSDEVAATEALGANQLPSFALPSSPNIAERIYALTTDNQLISFNSTDPGTILSAHTVSGLQANEKIVGIDFWNGTLYGLGDQNHLYTLNLANGAAGLVGSFSPVMNGEAFGFEAEPGGLRLVSNLDQDLLLNYSTGAATVGPTINGSPNPAITGLAYHPGNGIRYVADYSQNTFGLLNPASGFVTTIGLSSDFSRYNGFDISSNPGNTAYLASPELSSGLAANLYTVDLTTGSKTFVGLIGLDGDNTLIRGLSVGPGYVNLDPTNLLMNVSGSQLTLSWPSDHIGWRLQVQTNTLSTGLGTNWFTLPSSTGTNWMVVPIGGEGGLSVLYRLVYP